MSICCEDCGSKDHVTQECPNSPLDFCPPTEHETKPNNLTPRRCSCGQEEWSGNKLSEEGFCGDCLSRGVWTRKS